MHYVFFAKIDKKSLNTHLLSLLSDKKTYRPSRDLIRYAIVHITNILSVSRRTAPLGGVLSLPKHAQYW
jgi:hypothetical protein